MFFRPRLSGDHLANLQISLQGIVQQELIRQRSIGLTRLGDPYRTPTEQPGEWSRGDSKTWSTYGHHQTPVSLRFPFTILDEKTSRLSHTSTALRLFDC